MISQNSQSVPGEYYIRGDASFGTKNTACTRTKVNSSCALVQCSGLPPTDFNDAGDITVSGLSSFTMTYKSGYSYYSPGKTQLFKGGQQLSVSAAGATVPAFNASVVTPTPIAMTSPPVDKSGSCLIQKGQDIQFSWTGGATGDTVVVTAGSGQGTLTCQFDAGTGHGTMPYQGGLDHVEVGQGATSFAISHRVTRHASVQAGAYPVDVEVDALDTACYAIPQ